MNSMPQVISGSSASSSAAAANDSESSGGAEHKLPNMSEFLPYFLCIKLLLNGINSKIGLLKFKFRNYFITELNDS